MNIYMLFKELGIIHPYFNQITECVVNESHSIEEIMKLIGDRASQEDVEKYLICSRKRANRYKKEYIQSQRFCSHNSYKQIN